MIETFGAEWVFFLYILVGFALTIYWNRDDDGLVNDTILIGWFLWPAYSVLFLPEFLSGIKSDHIENKKVCEWNRKNGVGLCVEFIDCDKISHNGKTRGCAYLNGVWGACVDVRDDKKDGKYHIDYIYPLSGLRIKGMD